MDPFADVLGAHRGAGERSLPDLCHADARRERLAYRLLDAARASEPGAALAHLQECRPHHLAHPKVSEFVGALAVASVFGAREHETPKVGVLLAALGIVPIIAARLLVTYDGQIHVWPDGAESFDANYQSERPFESSSEQRLPHDLHLASAKRRAACGQQLTLSARALRGMWAVPQASYWPKTVRERAPLARCERCAQRLSALCERHVGLRVERYERYSERIFDERADCELQARAARALSATLTELLAGPEPVGESRLLALSRELWRSQALAHAAAFACGREDVLRRALGSCYADLRRERFGRSPGNRLAGELSAAQWERALAQLLATRRYMPDEYQTVLRGQMLAGG